MEKKVNYSIVGVFVLLLSTALVAGVIWLSAGVQLRKNYDIYLCYIDESVSGLNPNAPVRYRGVNVGRVKEIALSTDRVLLTLEIERGTPIRENTLATLRSQGLTGISYVELSGGTHDSPILTAKGVQKYPVIPSAPSLMARLDTSVSTVLARLDQTLTDLNAVLDENSRKNIRSMLADLAKVSHTLAARSDNINSGLKNADILMKNGALASEDLPNLVKRLDKSAEEIGKMAQDAGKTSKEARKMIENADASLPEMNALIKEMRALSVTLNQLAKEIERNPNSLIYGNRPPPGPGE